jgi:hypothetical protein
MLVLRNEVEVGDGGGVGLSPLAFREYTKERLVLLSPVAVAVTR